MTTTFGHWLAGFIAGEGCFRIHKEKQGGYYACHFTLKLRDDDAAILEVIRKRTGIGFLKADRTEHNGGRPSMVWTVYSRSDCLKLVALLDQYPIRARKRLDYALWRQAVVYWSRMKRGNRWDGPRDWTRMVRFKDDLAKLRAYPG